MSRHHKAPPITQWLIRHRDAAGEAWVREHRRNTDLWVTSTAEKRARRRLAVWDALLDAWTANGTRRA